ncbi:MAG: CAP domain-containing protein [Dichotomicrobium sp.]
MVNALRGRLGTGDMTGRRRAGGAVGTVAVLLTVMPLAGCSVNTATMGGFAGETAEPQAAKEAKKSENSAEPSLSQRLSALWSRATASTGDEELQTVAPAESFEPEQALALVNAYREEKGLAPLSLDPKLRQAADAHAQDLAKHDRISHFGSDGSDPWERVQRTGFEPKVAAENVGTGQITFGEVFREWKLSPDHNRNLLLPDATHMGVAVAREPDTQFETFWSLVVGSPS